MPVTNNLFKFVAVRPAQKISQDNRRRRFFKYAPDGAQPRLYQQLMAQDSMAERKGTAADFIRSDHYVAGFDHAATWIAFLQRIFDTLNSLVKQRAGLEPVRAEAQKWTDQQAEQLSDIKNQLWSSLYAAVVSPRTLPHDRKELIDLIRVLFFVENRDSFDTWQQVSGLLRAKPLVPEELFVVQPAPQTPDDESGGPNSPTWQKQKLDLFEGLREQVYALEDAILEIETAERRRLSRLDRRPKSGA